MELSDASKIALNQALEMARNEGFIFVAAAFNEHDNSIQFINNDSLSRVACTKILATAVETLRDHSARCSKNEPLDLTIGEA